MRLLAALVLAACSTPGDPKITTVDSAPHHGLTATEITCDKHNKRTLTANDGSKEITTTDFAITSLVHAGDDFAIEFCDAQHTTGPVCPPGLGCGFEGDSLPVTSCISTRNGTFTADNLYIECVRSDANYNPGGSEISRTTFGWATVRLYH